LQHSGKLVIIAGKKNQEENLKEAWPWT